MFVTAAVRVCYRCSKGKAMLIRVLLLALMLSGELMALQSEPAAFVAYYWRARPGRVQEYNDYITKVAVPIDEDARRAGVFEEVRTVMPTPAPGGALPDWTHLRIFRLRNKAAVDQLSAGLDAATARVVASETQRQENSARSSELRDLVRREVWTELR
jgi:hypothetical protein